MNFKISLIFLTVLLSSCIGIPKESIVEKQTAESSKNTGKDITALEAPAMWGNEFPINLKVDMILGYYFDWIVQEAKEWKEAGANELEFFSVKEWAPVNTRKTIEDYHDDEYGIYGLNNWFVELPQNALAVTIAYATIHDKGLATEKMFYTHADILVNLQNFELSANNSENSYDLPTVVLHEMGHFIGMKHQDDFSIPSIMHPSLTPQTLNRVPSFYDQQVIAATYEINIAILSSVLSSQSVLSAFSVVEEKPVMTTHNNREEKVMIIFEHKANGICGHTQHTLK